MKIQLIRNATIKLNYGGSGFLVDPMFSKKGAFRSFAGKEKNPTTGLPIEVDKICEGLDAVLVTHLHPDHFDEAAKAALEKDIPLFCQPNDNEKILEDGFQKVLVVEEQQDWKGISISRTDGEHGSGPILERMGEVSGFVLTAPEEPTLYIVGDSIWNKKVEHALEKFKPDVIVTNSGGAIIPGFEKNPILMNEADTINVLQKLPRSKVVAVHMESLDHCEVTRLSLRQAARQQDIEDARLYIPQNGETLSFEA